MNMCPGLQLDATACPRTVLDTNVVLDLWWFEDPRCASLAAAVTAGVVEWWMHEDMGAELHDVLARPRFARDRQRCERVQQATRRWARTMPAERPPAIRLRCDDPDDQIFLDAAVAVRARTLVTRDRAMLVLASRAAPWGLRIVRPDDPGWSETGRPISAAGRGP